MMFVVQSERASQFVTKDGRDVTTDVIDGIVGAFNISSHAAGMRIRPDATKKQVDEAICLMLKAWDVVATNVRMFSTRPPAWN